MFEYVGKDRSEIGAVDFSDSKSMTKQEFKGECDINVIMSKYLKSGVYPENVKVGQYGDFSDAGDFRESLHRIDNAKAQFAGLPAKVRDRFKNDPFEFLAFVADKGNFEEAVSLGLLSDEAVKRNQAAKDKAMAEAAALAAVVASNKK